MEVLDHRTIAVRRDADNCISRSYLSIITNATVEPLTARLDARPETCTTWPSPRPFRAPVRRRYIGWTGCYPVFSVPSVPIRLALSDFRRHEWRHLSQT